MSLPDRIHVKISSEAAGYISITPVVKQQMPAADLIETILGVTGKDAVRIRDILLRGAVVSGVSRFRWAPIEAGLDEVAQALEAFPDPQPDRTLDPSMCVRVVLTGGRAAIDLTRESASRKRWFARRSFWQALMETATRLHPTYQNYSYVDRADVYRLELPLETARELREQAKLLRYAALESKVRGSAFDKLELWVERSTPAPS